MWAAKAMIFRCVPFLIQRNEGLYNACVISGNEGKPLVFFRDARIPLTFLGLLFLGHSYPSSFSLSYPQRLSAGY